MNKLVKYYTHIIVYLFFRPKSLDLNEMQQKWKEAKVCCVICASGIGDSIMATPLIEMIKKCNPQSRLIVVSKKPCSNVFKKNLFVSDIIEYSQKYKDFFSNILMLWKLRQEKIDVLFAAQPANTICHSLISAVSGAKIKLKHTYDYGVSFIRDFSFLYNRLLPDSMARHRVELNLDFLRFLGEKIEEKAVFPQFFIDQKCQKNIDNLLQSYDKDDYYDKLIAIHPGGTRQNKRWPTECFAEVCKKLTDLAFAICLVGGKYEIDTCNDIAKKTGIDRTLNFARNTTLEETGAILKRCQCLISNDTGIMHLATSVDVPVIAIFGPTDFRHIGPYSKKAKVIFNSDNIKNISVKKVLKELLAKKQGFK